MVTWNAGRISHSNCMSLTACCRLRERPTLLGASAAKASFALIRVTDFASETRGTTMAFTKVLCSMEPGKQSSKSKRSLFLLTRAMGCDSRWCAGLVLDSRTVLNSDQSETPPFCHWDVGEDSRKSSPIVLAPEFSDPTTEDDFPLPPFAVMRTPEPSQETVPP